MSSGENEKSIPDLKNSDGNLPFPSPEERSSGTRNIELVDTHQSSEVVTVFPSNPELVDSLSVPNNELQIDHDVSVHTAENSSLNEINQTTPPGNILEYNPELVIIPNSDLQVDNDVRSNFEQNSLEIVIQQTEFLEISSGNEIKTTEPSQDIQPASNADLIIASAMSEFWMETDVCAYVNLNSSGNEISHNRDLVYDIPYGTDGNFRQLIDLSDVLERCDTHSSAPERCHGFAEIARRFLHLFETFRRTRMGNFAVYSPATRNDNSPSETENKEVPSGNNAENEQVDDALCICQREAVSSSHNCSDYRRRTFTAVQEFLKQCNNNKEALSVRRDGNYSCSWPILRDSFPTAPVPINPVNQETNNTCTNNSTKKNSNRVSEVKKKNTNRNISPINDTPSPSEVNTDDALENITTDDFIWTTTEDEDSDRTEDEINHSPDSNSSRNTPPSPSKKTNGISLRKTSETSERKVSENDNHEQVAKSLSSYQDEFVSNPEVDIASTDSATNTVYEEEKENSKRAPNSTDKTSPCVSESQSYSSSADISSSGDSSPTVSEDEKNHNPGINSTGNKSSSQIEKNNAILLSKIYKSSKRKTPKTHSYEQTARTSNTEVDIASTNNTSSTVSKEEKSKTNTHINSRKVSPSLEEKSDFKRFSSHAAVTTKRKATGNVYDELVELVAKKRSVMWCKFDSNPEVDFAPANNASNNEEEWEEYLDTDTNSKSRTSPSPAENNRATLLSNHAEILKEKLTEIQNQHEAERSFKFHGECKFCAYDADSTNNASTTVSVEDGSNHNPDVISISDTSPTVSENKEGVLLSNAASTTKRKATRIHEHQAKRQLLGECDDNSQDIIDSTNNESTTVSDENRNVTSKSTEVVPPVAAAQQLRNGRVNQQQTDPNYSGIRVLLIEQHFTLALIAALICASYYEPNLIPYRHTTLVYIAFVTRMKEQLEAIKYRLWILEMSHTSRCNLRNDVDMEQVRKLQHLHSVIFNFLIRLTRALMSAYKHEFPDNNQP